METKVVKWKKGDKAGEMERWRKASGEEEGGGRERKMRVEARSERKAKQKRGATGVKRQKSREAR